MWIEFRWRDAKAASNLRKHGISFVEATEIFSDPRALSFADEHHSQDEERLITIGLSARLRVLLVVHTEVGSFDEGVIIRIISARKATREERRVYEER